MDLACRDHVADQAVNGGTDSTGSDDSTPFDRMNTYGEVTGDPAESIVYDNSVTADILLHLIVGDGDSNRTDRGNVLSDVFTIVGLATGTHLDGTTMAVIGFAEDYTEEADIVVEPETTLSEDIFNAINDLRAVPTSLVAALETYIAAFNDLTVTIDGVDTITTEGTVPV